MKPYYLAGPMSGLPQLNFPAFDAAAIELREMGYDIMSPAEVDDEETRAAALLSDGELTDRGTWGDFLSRDIKLLVDECRDIILLPGWEKSRGARLEAFAAINCGYMVYCYYPEYFILAAMNYTTILYIMTEELRRDLTD